MSSWKTSYVCECVLGGIFYVFSFWKCAFMWQKGENYFCTFELFIHVFDVRIKTKVKTKTQTNMMVALMQSQHVQRFTAYGQLQAQWKCKYCFKTNFNLEINVLIILKKKNQYNFNASPVHIILTWHFQSTAKKILVSLNSPFHQPTPLHFF